MANLHVHWNLFQEDAEWKKNRWDQLTEIESLTRYHFDRQSSISDQLYALADKIAAMYWDAASDEIAVISSLHHNSAYRIPKSFFKEVIRVPLRIRRSPS